MADFHISQDVRSDDAECAAILAQRSASNAALARRDAAGVVASMLPTYRGTWAQSIKHSSRDTTYTTLKRRFTDEAMLGFVRTPTRVQISETGPAAAEYGEWVGRERVATGVQELAGTYFAAWQRTEDGWRISSEIFVALTTRIVPE